MGLVQLPRCRIYMLSTASHPFRRLNRGSVAPVTQPRFYHIRNPRKVLRRLYGGADSPHERGEKDAVTYW